MFCRAVNGNTPAEQAQAWRREAQIRALEKFRASEKELRTRITVIIKALEKGWEYASAYEQVLAGKKEDPFDERARKLMDEKRREKEADDRKSFKTKGEKSNKSRQRSHPYSSSQTTYSVQPQQWSEQSAGQFAQFLYAPQWGYPPQWYPQQSFLASHVGAGIQPPPPPPLQTPSGKQSSAQPRPSAVVAAETPKKEFHCFACGKPGHSAKYCLENK